MLSALGTMELVLQEAHVERSVERCNDCSLKSLRDVGCQVRKQRGTQNVVVSNPVNTGRVNGTVRIDESVEDEAGFHVRVDTNNSDLDDPTAGLGGEARRFEVDHGNGGVYQSPSPDGHVVVPPPEVSALADARPVARMIVCEQIGGETVFLLPLGLIGGLERLVHGGNRLPEFLGFRNRGEFGL